MQHQSSSLDSSGRREFKVGPVHFSSPPAAAAALGAGCGRDSCRSLGSGLLGLPAAWDPTFTPAPPPPPAPLQTERPLSTGVSALVGGRDGGGVGGGGESEAGDGGGRRARTQPAAGGGGGQPSVPATAITAFLRHLTSRETVRKVGFSKSELGFPKMYQPAASITRRKKKGFCNA